MSKPTIPHLNQRPGSCLAGLLSPPANGHALAFDTLCRGLGVHNYDCRVVNIQRKNLSSPGRFTIARSIETLHALRRLVGGLIAGYRRVYITTSRSRVGFALNMLMI